MTVLRWIGFPVLMAGAIALCAALMESAHLGAAVASSIVVVLLWAILWGLERALPYRREWNAPDESKLADVGHAIFGTALGGSLGTLFVEVSFGALGLVLAASSRDRFWPSHWPLPLQVVLVVLIADLGRYVQHRLLHAVPWLWRIHELHHSTPSLTVFKASRNHVTERVMQMVFMFGPLIFLGVPPEVLAYYIVPNTFLGLFAHSNVDFRLGPLEMIFMGPGSHRIHHSADHAQGNSNFGSAIVIWDIVFRTYKNPLTVPLAESMGIKNDPTPRGFVAQVLEPLRRR